MQFSKGWQIKGLKFGDKLIELNNLCRTKQEKHATRGLYLCFKHNRNKNINLASYCLPYTSYTTLVVTEIICRVVYFETCLLPFLRHISFCLLYHLLQYHQISWLCFFYNLIILWSYSDLANKKSEMLSRCCSPHNTLP